ncbi:MAG: hypothetical protein ABI606_13010 [Rhodoferax sp.]
MRKNTTELLARTGTPSGRLFRSLGMLSILLLTAYAPSCAYAQADIAAKANPAQENEIFDPVGWAEEQAFYKQRQDRLLTHIQGARNIEVAKGWQGIAPWPINWDAQQKFCHRVADVLFKEPQRLKFPEPDFAAYRDSAEKLKEVLPVAFPKCANRDNEAESAYLNERPEWRKAPGDYEPSAATTPRYYASKNIFIREYRNTVLRPTIDSARGKLSVFALPEILRKIEIVSYDYEAGLDEKGCPLWGATFMEDNNWDRAENSKMVLTRIDDEYVFVEIGTFDNDHGVSAARAKATGGWFSTPGKRYVTATGIHNNLYYTLIPEAKRSRRYIYDPPLNSGGAMQNWAEPYAYACVINFDGPVHTLPRSKLQ